MITRVNHQLRRPLAAGLLAIATTLTGCGDAGAVGGWAGTVDTLANGAVLVSSPEAGIWDDETAWRLEEDLRIGSAEIEGPELFGNVGGLAVDELGRIYVGESQASEIRVFGADGAHVRTIGRKGGGPGEFEAISGMGWGPDGNLWVMDHTNSRFSVFDTTGAYVTSHRRPGGFVIIPWPGGFDRNGRVYDATGIPGPDRFTTALIRYTADMTPADTFRIPEYDAETFDMSDDGGRRRMSAAVPFAPAQGWTLDADGNVWIGTSDRYRIHRVTFAGDTVAAVERRYTPVAVTEEEKDERIERFEWFTRQGGEIQRSRIPNVKPAFGSFFADDEGYLWVTANRPADAPAGLDVFDPDGRFLGTVTGGGELMSPPVIAGDMLYAVVRDELEVPYVVRYRIRGRAEPSRAQSSKD